MLMVSSGAADVNVRRLDPVRPNHPEGAPRGCPTPNTEHLLEPNAVVVAVEVEGKLPAGDEFRPPDLAVLLGVARLPEPFQQAVVPRHQAPVLRAPAGLADHLRQAVDLLLWQHVVPAP